MSSQLQRDIVNALGPIHLPDAPEDVTMDDFITTFKLVPTPQGPELRLILSLPPDLTPEQREALKLKAEQALLKISNGAKPIIIFAEHRPAPQADPRITLKPGEEPKAAQAATMPHPEMPKGVKKIIAVASAKGGVGKSTTAVNLALALAAYHGLKVGILDADIHGPSIPRLMGLREQMEENEDGMMLPHHAHGVSAVSIGFLVPENKPVIWRGPMVHGALKQMLHNVEWGDCDVLILDMPPGTGDTAISVAQHVPLSGAVIVSTPQDLALIDARKGVEMFKKMNVPILGMIENMSGFECPHCHGMTPVFGEGGAKKDAEEYGIPFLGHVPLDLRLRETSDAGTPIVAHEPDGHHAQVYKQMASLIRKNIFD